MREFELDYNVDPLEVILNAYARKSENDRVEVYDLVAVLVAAIYAYLAAIHTVALAVLVAVGVGVYVYTGVNIS